MAKFDYYKLTDDSQRNVDTLLTALDKFNTEKGDASFSSKCVDIESMGLGYRISQRDLQAKIDDPAYSQKVITLTSGLTGDSTQLYAFGKDYPVSELRGQSFVVDKNGKSFVVIGVNSASADPGSPTQLEVRGLTGSMADLNNLSRETSSYTKIRDYTDPSRGLITRENIYFVGNLGKIIGSRCPKLENEPIKDVYGCFDLPVSSRTIVYGMGRKATKNAYFDAKRSQKKMAKGKPVRKGAPVLNDDIAQLIFVRDRASEKGALDIFININPNASTIRYDYDPATGKLIDAMGNPLPFEAFTDSRQNPGTLFKVSLQGIKVLDDNHVALNLYDATTDTARKGEHPRRVILETDTQLIRVLQDAIAHNSTRDGFKTAFAPILSGLSSTEKKSVDNLNRVVNRSIADRARVARGEITEAESDQKGFFDKVSPMLKTLGEKIWSIAKGVLLFLGGSALGAGLTAGAGDIDVAANSDKAEEYAQGKATTKIVRTAEDIEEANAASYNELASRLVMATTSGKNAKTTLTTKTTDNSSIVLDGFMKYSYSGDGNEGTVTIEPGRASIISQNDFNDLVTSEEVADSVAPFGTNYSFSAIGGKGNIYKRETRIGAVRALASEVAKEVSSLEKRGLELPEGTVIYPSKSGDLTSESQYISEREEMGDQYATEVAKAYTDAYTISYTLSNQDNQHDANRNPILPEDYEEIEDGQHYYINNETLISTVRDIIGATDAQIETINVVQPNADGQGIITVYATSNDGANAHEISILIDDAVSTTKDVYTALQNASKEYSRSSICEDFVSAESVLSQFKINSKRLNTYMANEFGTRVGNGTTYVSAKPDATKNINEYSLSILYVGENGVTSTIVDSIKFNGTSVQTDNVIQTSALVAMYNGSTPSSFPSYKISIDSNSAVYQNQGEVYVAPDLEIPEEESTATASTVRHKSTDDGRSK